MVLGAQTSILLAETSGISALHGLQTDQPQAWHTAGSLILTPCGQSELSEAAVQRSSHIADRS